MYSKINILLDLSQSLENFCVCGSRLPATYDLSNKPDALSMIRFVAVRLMAMPIPKLKENDTLSVATRSAMS